MATSKYPFPFEVVEPEEMVPGNKYYFMASTAIKRKTNQGQVTKFSGIFKELVKHKARYEREKTYASFTGVKVEDRAAKTLRYNSGRIQNPYINNIYKVVRNKTQRVRNVKAAGHQEKNIRTFGDKEWLFDVSTWKFGKGIRNAASKYMTTSVMANKTGIDINNYIQSFYPKTNANTNFVYVEEEGGNNKNNTTRKNNNK